MRNARSPGARSFFAAALLIHLSAPQAFITAPMFVEAMVRWLALTPAEAGYVQAAESLGKATAAICLLFLVGRVDWRKLVRVALVVLAVGNLLCMWITDFAQLAIVRFVCGMVPGVVVPIAYAMTGMTAQRERNFGWLLTTLLTYAALAFAVMPTLYSIFGIAGGLGFYAAFALLGLAFTSKVPHGDEGRAETGGGDEAGAIVLPGVLRPPTVLTLAFYFVGMSSAWAYFSLIATAGGLSEASVARVLAMSQLFGILGGLLVVASGERLGRLGPICVGLLATVGALLLLVRDEISVVAFGVSAFTFAFFWNHTHPYLLAALSGFDPRGRLVVYATVAQMCGIAVGPALAATLVERGTAYSVVVAVSASSLFVALCCIAPALVWHARIVRSAVPSAARRSASAG